jgi:uncharacterized membrane protein YecN with MAPEG domain
VINREFGLLEHLQLLVIAVTVYFSFQLFRRDTTWWRKSGFFLLFLILILLFLEEIDYGIHYYELLFHGGAKTELEVRNIHNQDDNNYYIRQAAYTIMAIFFVLLPLLRSKFRNPYLQFISGERWLIATFGVYLFTGILARGLPKLGFPNNPSLWGNHQEFEELIAYYLIALFIWGLLQRHHLLPGKKATS